MATAEADNNPRLPSRAKPKADPVSKCRLDFLPILGPFSIDSGDKKFGDGTVTYS
jgi:hypothetical protein